MDYLRKISIIFSLFLILCSCADTPENVLTRYLKAVNQCNYTQAYSCLSHQDTSQVSLEEYSQTGSLITEVLGTYTKFQIVSQNISPTGNTVTIKVESNRVDLLNIYKRIPLLTQRNLTKPQIKQLLRQNRQEIDVCRITSTEDYTLISENGKWRVSADLGRIKYARQLQDTALEYEKRGMFDDALKTIDKMSEIGCMNEQMSQAYLRIADKQDYIKNNLKISKIFTNSGARIVITNDGTYGVKKLAVDIMYEKNGTQYTSHQTSDLGGKPFIGHGEQYPFYIDFNGGTIMDITKLEARVINVEF